MEVEKQSLLIDDIVSTSREKLEKFIRELHRLTTYVKTLEMPGEDLAASTVLPNQGRILKQYTIDDIKKELKYFTELQSDKSAFIKGIEIRKEDIV